MLDSKLKTKPCLQIINATKKKQALALCDNCGTQRTSFYREVSLPQGFKDVFLKRVRYCDKQFLCRHITSRGFCYFFLFFSSKTQRQWKFPSFHILKSYAVNQFYEKNFYSSSGHTYCDVNSQSHMLDLLIISYHTQMISR